MVRTDLLKAPFPYMGGKSKIADWVWDRFGNVENYIEPFCGSAAVLLRRPLDHLESSKARRETLNDASHFLVNFWRSVQHDPEQVARWADNPVFEADLHAVHLWLMQQTRGQEWRDKMRNDPDFYDAKIAGRWVWGACCWIGKGWCQGYSHQMPELDHARGVNKGLLMSRERHIWLTQWMHALSDRLRLVRTCYGHWSRICDSPSTMTRLGTCGVFLDPPYPINQGEKKSRSKGLYENDTQDLDALRDEILAWCKNWGKDKQVRIAMCGYEGDGYEELVRNHGWEEQAWETQGGYGNQAKTKSENYKRERIWWSPYCKHEPTLFDCIAEF